MNSPKVSYLQKALLMIFFIAGLTLIPTFTGAQEQQQSDENKEYKATLDIQAEKDPAKKIEMLFTLLKESPQGKYALPEYQNMLNELMQKREWERIIPLCERYLKLVPADKFSISYLTAAYSETKNTKGFVAYAEKVYAEKPTPDFAYLIASGYKELGNDAKFMQWAEKAVAGNSTYVDLLSELVRRASVQQNNTMAVKYAKMCLKALPAAPKPEGTDAKTWKNFTDTSYAISYAAIGNAAYENQNYAEAITNLESAVKYLKNMDRAYYFLGMSYWQANKLQPAELNFAKAYVIKGSVSSAAKKQLDSLWSQTHKGSLAGLDMVIEKAKQDLK
jgi:tetratricopeptide (TPR) repeat protein